MLQTVLCKLTACWGRGVSCTATQRRNAGKIRMPFSQSRAKMSRVDSETQRGLVHVCKRRKKKLYICRVFTAVEEADSKTTDPQFQSSRVPVFHDEGLGVGDGDGIHERLGGSASIIFVFTILIQQPELLLPSADSTSISIFI